MDFDDDYVDSLISSSYHSVGVASRSSGAVASSAGNDTSSINGKANKRQKRPPLASLPPNLSTKSLHDDKSLSSNTNSDFYLTNTRTISNRLIPLKPFNNIDINMKKTKLNDKSKADPVKESHIVLISGFAEDFRKWCEIRVKYVHHIKNLCQVITEADSNSDNANVVIYNGFKVNYDSIRPQFLILVAALRKINCKLVQTFQRTITELDNSNYNKYDITKHLLRQIELYLYHEVIPSLNWLHRLPYLTWLGVATTINNPFLLPATADGSLATAGNGSSASNANGVAVSCPKELALSDMDRAASELFNTVLVNIYKFNRDADIAVVTVIPIDTKDGLKADGHDTINAHNSNNNNVISKEKEELVTFVQKNLAAGFWWMRWRKSYRISSKITTFLQNKEQLFLRRVFNELQTYCWKCISFRNLQLKTFRNLKIMALQGWKQYCRWVRRFNKVLNRSNRKIKRRYLHAMFRFSQMFHGCRDYKKKYLLKIKREVFDNFKTIVVLNRHSLRRRLRANSHLTFQEMFMRKAYFVVWFNNASVLRSYRALDELIIKDSLGKAFGKLRENAFPTIPFEQRMAMVRDAVQRELIKTLKFSKQKVFKSAQITRVLTQSALRVGQEKGIVLISKMKSKIEEIKQQRADGKSLYDIAIGQKKVDPVVANARRKKRIQAALKHSIKDNGDDM